MTPTRWKINVPVHAGESSAVYEPGMNQVVQVVIKYSLWSIKSRDELSFQRERSSLSSQISLLLFSKAEKNRVDVYLLSVIKIQLPLVLMFNSDSFPFARYCD